MKDYHDYLKKFIGMSDIASLILVGLDEDEKLKTMPLNFGEDGDYMAYIIPGDVDVPDYYEKIADFSYWLKIYDDDELTSEFNAKKIEVFTAGDFGCIIRLSKDTDYKFQDKDYQIIENI